jgi:hypothetical protein
MGYGSHLCRLNGTGRVPLMTILKASRKYSTLYVSDKRILMANEPGHHNEILSAMRRYHAIVSKVRHMVTNYL